MSDPPELPFAAVVSPAPGVVVERRGFLATTAAALAAAWVPGADRRWQDRQGEADGFSVEEFVRTVAPVCRELVADRSARGQDRYLLTLAACAVRLTNVPVPADRRDTGAGKWIGSNHGPDPFTVLHWHLEPGAVIEPHAHTYGNVVTLGLEGAAIVRNYEMLGGRDVDSRAPFRAQCTVEQVLRPGDVNLVSLERNYVHGFVGGPQGARGLDITTRIVPKRSSPVLVLGDCVDAGQRVFQASWRGDD